MSNVGRAQRRSSVVKPASPPRALDADLLLELPLVERQRRKLPPLVGRERHHVVVEAGNRHPALRVAQCRKHLAQGHRPD